jgi:OOP family OmpA-OmpF porin
MKKKLLLAGLLGVITLPAMADNFYLLGDVGQGKMEVDASNNYTYSKTSTTYSIGAGYDINQFFAVELAYRDLGNVKDRGSYLNGGIQYTYTDKTSATALQASVIARLPISDEFSIYGRVGLGKIDVNYDTVETGAGSTLSDTSSDSKTKGLLGIGASYSITPQIALRAEYNQYAKWDDTKLSAISAGATYHF